MKNLYFCIAAACCALGAAAFGLTFSALKIYALIAAILFELAALAFAGLQKKKNNFKGVLVLKIISYILLFAFAAFFVGGLIYSAI